MSQEEKPKINVEILIKQVKIGGIVFGALDFYVSKVSTFLGPWPTAPV